MNISRLIAAGLIAAACTVGAHAEALYMHLQDANGNWTVYDLEQVDRLTFSDGKMNIEKDGQTVASASTTELARFYVNDTTGVNAVAGDNEAADILSVAGRTLSLKADSSLRVYAASGALLVEIPAVKAGQTVDLSSLPAGIYMIATGNKTLKIALQ